MFRQRGKYLISKTIQKKHSLLKNNLTPQHITAAVIYRRSDTWGNNQYE